MTADFRMPNYQTREGFIEAIRQAGEYITDHADNLLGEYPALLSEMDLTVHFRYCELVTIDVKRQHIVCERGQYPTVLKRAEKPLERSNSQKGTRRPKRARK